MVDTVSFQSEQTGQEAPKAPENNTPAAASGNRPAWLPEDFKGTPEEYVASLTKSRDDTKAELTRLQQEVAKTKKPKEDGKPAGEEKPKEGDLEVKEDDETDGENTPPPSIDFTPYQQEFETTGDVSAESRTKIAESLKSVFGENAETVVNEYIDGAKTRLTNTASQIKAIAGGDKGYAELTAWAKDNLSPAEKAAYNRAVNGGDFHAASFAVQGLMAKYQQVNGKAPNLIQGDNSVIEAGGFKSLNEMKLAIADPRYKTDPDYRKSVEQRAAKSNI